MTGSTPRCCGCINILTGTTILVVLYLIGGSLCTVSGVMGLARNTDYGAYGEMYHSSSTTSWINLANGLLVMLFASLALHSLRNKRSGYMMPLFVYQLFDILCYVIVIGIIIIYWSAIYNYIEEYVSMMGSDVQESFNSISPSTFKGIVIGTLVLFMLIKIYFATVVYRCHKHIVTQAFAPQPISTLAWNQASVENGIHIYNYRQPPTYTDVQKIPLVEDVEPVDDQKPPVYAA
uniref:Lysosomal-associated transmembrane protein 4A n=1 Tax=Phallusia mammillata TaxID=59560 RepID=A0A6F9DIT6_9ASCI|nr:lysosomal-associated transmembrane protein 4A [Phallusia mammillata]